MARITGIGGIFFRADDGKALAGWYRDALGLDTSGSAGILRFREEARPDVDAYAIWAPFPRDTDYFGSAEQPFMINLRVDDLDGALAQVRAAGAQVVGDIETHEQGRFAWFIDPAGMRIELWEQRGDAARPAGG